MRPVWLLCLAFTSISCSPATVVDQPAALVPASPTISTVRQELEATFAARMRAYEMKDYAALIDQVSPVYSAIRPNGARMTRDDLSGYIRLNLERWVRIIRQSNLIENVRLEGPNAVVDVRQDVARVQIVDGREAIVESSIVQTETWTPTSSGWKLLSVRDERDGWIRIDGNPVR